MDREMDRDYERKEDRTFWLSLFSAVGVLAVIGLVIYAGQVGNPSSPVQPGVGGGPGTISTPAPTPSPTPTPLPTINPDVTPDVTPMTPALP